MKYSVIMKTEDGYVFIQQSDKLSTAKHYYDDFVNSGRKSNNGFHVTLLENDKEKMSFNGWHTAQKGLK